MAPSPKLPVISKMERHASLVKNHLSSPFYILIEKATSHVYQLLTTFFKKQFNPHVRLILMVFKNHVRQNGGQLRSGRRLIIMDNQSFVCMLLYTPLVGLAVVDGWIIIKKKKLDDVRFIALKGGSSSVYNKPFLCIKRPYILWYAISLQSVISAQDTQFTFIINVHFTCLPIL